MLLRSGVRHFVLTFALLAAVVTAGCSDDPEAASVARPSTAAATVESVAPTGEASPASPAPPPPTPTATTVPVDIDDVREAAERFAGASFTATYAITADRSADGFTGGEMTLGRDASRMRLDVRADQGEGVLAGVFVDAAPIRGFCLHQAGDLGLLLGVDPASGICFPADPGSETPGLLRQFAALPGLTDSARAPERRPVAGVTALCGDFGPDEAPQRLCFAESGALVYFADPAGLTLEATNVRDGADAGGFAFPYDIRDLPPP